MTVRIFLTRILAVLYSQKIQLSEQQVKRTRADWEGPSAQSVFYCKHFTKDCFKKDTEYAARLRNAVG